MLLLTTVSGFYLVLATGAYLATYLPTITLLLSLITWIWPVFIPLSHPIWRAICAISSPFYAIRLAELGYTRLFGSSEEQKSLHVSRCDANDENQVNPDPVEQGGNGEQWKRMLHPFLYFHVHQTRSTASPVQVLKWLLPKYLTYTLLTLLLFYILDQTSAHAHVETIPLLILLTRYASTTVLLYTFLYTTEYSLKLLAISLFGLEIPQSHRVHRAPIQARSLNELWSHRWNAVMQKQVLKRYVFSPIYRMGLARPDRCSSGDGGIGGRKSVGVVAAGVTFLVSGLWHAVPIWAAHGLIPHIPLFETLFDYPTASIIPTASTIPTAPTGLDHGNHHLHHVESGKKAIISVTWTEEGLQMGLCVILFFMLQFMGILIEQVVFPSVDVYKKTDGGVEDVDREDREDRGGQVDEKKSELVRRLWTCGFVLFTAPLVIEPLFSLGRLPNY